MISKLDLMKLFSQYEGEISMSDFTPEELEEYLREAEGADAPLSPPSGRRATSNTTTTSKISL